MPKANLKMDNAMELLQCFSGVFAVELDRENAVVDPAFRALMQSIETATGQTYLTTNFKVGAVDTQIHYQKGAMPKEEKTGQAPLGFFTSMFAPGDSKTLPFFTAYARYDLDVETGAQPRKFVLFSDSIDALRKALNQIQTPRSSLAAASRSRPSTRTTPIRRRRVTTAAATCQGPRAAAKRGTASNGRHDCGPYSTT